MRIRRRCGRLWTPAALFVLGLAAAGGRGACAEALTSGEVRLTLQGAPPSPEAAPLAQVEMQLEIPCVNGQWQKNVWGYALWLNGGHHRGQVTEFQPQGDGLRAVITLEIAGDTAVPGGAAEYTLNLKREGNSFTGTYEGALLETKVSGQVVGTLAEPLIRPVKGFQALAPQEHPRLIFRKADLPELKKRMETPEGRILQALLSSAPARDVEQVGDKRSSWIAANWGMVYQLTGDKGAAEKARRILADEVVRKPMALERADIHLAPRLLGAALAYDLCYDAWDEEFRTQLTGYLYDAMLSLERGLSKGFPMADAMGNMPPPRDSPRGTVVCDINTFPWSHHNAMRMGAVGCAAIALCGEKTAAGSEAAEAPRVAEWALRDMVLYLRLGVGQSGCGAEGDFYKKFALANGVLQFMHAARVALGQDLSAVNRFLLAGQIAETVPGKEPNYGLCIRAIQGSGLSVMGFSTVPEEFLPVVKWCFDREAGLLGPKHFDCTYPFQVGYALLNYPFGVEAQPPAGALPWAVPDPVKGHYIFRKSWQDADDVLTTMNLRTMPCPRLQADSGGRMGEWHVWGLGREWLGGTIGLGEGNPWTGADVLSFETPRPRQALLRVRLDRALLQSNQNMQRRGGKAKPVQAAQVRLLGVEQPLFDLGLKGERCWAVDYSGACGAPALFALVDKLQNAKDEAWTLPFRDVKVAGGKLSASDASGANLNGVLLKSGPPADGAWLSGSNEYFLVFTLQKGPPPALTVAGEGLSAKVSVGGQTVSFDGERIVLGK